MTFNNNERIIYVEAQLIEGIIISDFISWKANRTTKNVIINNDEHWLIITVITLRKL
jgi:hypothetical protein